MGHLKSKNAGHTGANLTTEGLVFVFGATSPSGSGPPHSRTF